MAGLSAGMFEQDARAAAIRAELAREQAAPPGTWTLAAVKETLIEAAETLRRMPFPKNGAPQQVRATWPDCVREASEVWFAYDRTNPPHIRPASPNPGEIERMDQALCWLHWLTADQRRIVWGKSCKMSWRRLQDIDGRSDRTLRTLYNTAISIILAKLLKKHLPGFPENGR